MKLIEEIGSILEGQNHKISTAESCTSGYISNLLTTFPGSSKYFEGSIVAYSNKAKINILGVEKDLIDNHTEVSEQVAIRMAEKVKEVMKTEYSIATTGYSDINGFGTDENPAGTIYIAISTPFETIVKKIELRESRKRNTYLIAMESFEMLFQSIKTHQASQL